MISISAAIANLFAARMRAGVVGAYIPTSETKEIVITDALLTIGYVASGYIQQ